MSGTVKNHPSENYLGSPGDQKSNKTEVESIFEIKDEEVILEEDVDLIMDQGFAWVVCCCCFIMNFCTWGMNADYGIFLSHYLNQGMFGGTKLDFSFIGGIAFGVGIVFSPVYNYIMGKIGVNFCILLGACFQFTGLMLASFTTQLWQLYLTQGVLQSIGMAIVSIPCQTLLPQYFKKKRILATGIASAGSGAGGITFNLGMRKIMSSKSVFWALRAQAIIGFCLLFIPTLVVRSRAHNHKIKYNLIDKTIYTSAAFWLIVMFIITCMFGYVILFYTLANYSTTLGFSENQGAIVLTLVQVGATFGRPVVGYISDKYGAVTVATGAYALCGIFSLAMWIPARNYALILIFGFIEGALMGTVYGIVSPMAAKSFGMARMSIAFSNFWSILGMAGIFAPVIGLELKKGGGNFLDPTQYLNCQIFTGICLLGTAAFLLFLRGFLKARDHMLESLGDSDKIDYSQVSVPFTLAIANCFAKSHEKT
jgi:MFS family permease